MDALPDDLVAELGAVDVPVVLVTRSVDGARAVWQRGRVQGHPVDADTVQYAASVTKQFTAALVATAVLDGTLTEGTVLRDVVTRLPGWAERITLHDLVHHTAGLPRTVPGPAESELDNALVVAALESLAEPPAAPGTEFSYSNVGYVLLAEVLRSVTGRPVPDLARDMLFQPLGLSSACWGAGPPTSSPGFPDPPRTIGDGGSWLSTRDLSRWLEALQQDELGLAELLARPGLLRDRTQVDYAWGVTRREHPGGTLLTHGGDWPGWTAKTVRQPSTGLAVSVMTFGADARLVSDLAVRLVDRLLGGARPGR